MRVLKLLVQKYLIGLLVAILMGALSGGATAALLAIINQSLEQKDPLADQWLLMGFVGMMLLSPLLTVVSQYLLARIGQNAILNLRMDLSQRVLGAPLAQLEKIGPSRLWAALTSDVASISTALANIPLICINMTLVTGTLIYLGTLSWKLLLVLCGALAIGSISYQLPMSIAEKKQRQGRKIVDELYGHFRSLTHGTKELKMHQPRRLAFLGMLEETGQQFRQANLSARNIFNIADAWSQTLLFACIGALLFAAPLLGDVSTHVMVGYILALLFIVNPIGELLDAIPGLAQANIAMDKVESLGLSFANDLVDETESPQTLLGAGGGGVLEMEDVRYEYPADDDSRSFTVGPIDLRFAPGELVFIVGGNGSGKTSLAKILLGLYEPSAGEIRLGGTAVTTENRDAYRQQFTVVFADLFLFTTLLGLDGPDIDVRARDILVRLGLDHKVEIEDGQLSTVELSQGQKKRLGLLTAYLEDRPFYLFDEWAADQDPQFREFFYRELLPDLKAKGKTIFVISHDDRFYDLADRVIKLEEGQVVSGGSVERLQVSGIAS